MARNNEVRYRVDVRDVRGELNRLQRLPDEHADAAFESLLTGLFQETQMVVHRITGSLQASGKVDSYRTEKGWHGQIIYGGDLEFAPSPGPVKEPVDYAWFEQRRGGAHDFMAPLRDADPLWRRLMLDMIGGE